MSTETTDTDQSAGNPTETDVTAASSPATAQATPELASETSTGDDTADESQAEREKPKGGFQRRISELTRAQRELREQLAQERAAREALERGKQTPAETEPEPQRDQFESWDEYESARTRWVARQTYREESARERQATEAREAARQQQELHATWSDRLEAARDKFEDIDEYIDPVGERLTAQAPAVVQALMASELGPELVRHLGQNPKDLDRIARLPAIQGVYELARLEARLQAQPKASKAPPPPTSVKTASAPQNSLRDDTDTASWIKARREQLKARS